MTRCFQPPPIMLYANDRVLSTFAVRLDQGSVPMNVMMGAKLRAEFQSPRIGLAPQVPIMTLAIGTIAGFLFYLFDVAFAGVAMAAVAALIQLIFQTGEHDSARRRTEAAGTRTRS